jgi:hypothetical protein
LVADGKDIDEFESKQDKKRKDARIAAQKNETQRKQQEAKDKQREKAEKMLDF